MKFCGEEKDEFDKFCAMAGRARRLSSVDYGGSLPCISKTKSKGVKTPVKVTLSGGTLTVPYTLDMRRTLSDNGPGEAHSQFQHMDALVPSPGPSPGLYRRSKTQKILSSLRTIVDGCDTQCPSYKKCPSAPPSRSASVKKTRRYKQDIDSFRPRTSSMPTKSTYKKPNTLGIFSSRSGLIDDEDWLRVRNFVITPKGIINRGDSYKSRSSSSIGTIGSSNGGSFYAPSSHNGSMASVVSIPETLPYQVVLCGAAAVGKTTLAQQFLTSEGVATSEYDHLSEAEQTMTVSILLDEEEAVVDFIDLSYEENHRNVANVDSYIVVYSTNDRSTFHHALDIVFDLNKSLGSNQSIILVANKTDLVRIRQVATQEGRAAAETYKCKYVEVSALMNLNVDDLLVGVVSQIRLHQQKEHSKRSDGSRSQLGMIGRFIKKQMFVSRSCDNLLVI